MSNFPSLQEELQAGPEHNNNELFADALLDRELVCIGLTFNYLAFSIILFVFNFKCFVRRT
jgi:hypothetical protein